MDDRDSSPGGPGYRLNTTDAYHRGDLSTLGWELTVCNSLYPADTPIRRILEHNASYGHLLYEYLKGFVLLDGTRSILEIGGGYGYLMRDFLARNSAFRVCMVDIAPVLLARQKETLAGHNNITYRLENAMETNLAVLEGHDLAILNENLGDFPTLVDVDRRILESALSPDRDEMAAKVRRFFDTYGLARPGTAFNLNIGALEMVERLCSARIPCIFIGEHSCEAKVPPALKLYIRIDSDGNPRRISLKGHDEYTIKFSYLQRIAEHHGYETVRGPFADYIVPNLTEGLKAILASKGLCSDNGEAIYQFVGDLYEYEYLVLKKK